MLAGVDAAALLRDARGRAARDHAADRRASSAGSRPTTPACTATPSAPCRRAACPPPSWRTSSARSSGWPRAGRAPTGRSPPPSCATATASTRRARWPRSRPPASWSAASCRPGGSEREWCDPEVLRRLRRASLAVLRKEIEAADQRALATFLPSWQGVDRHPASGAGIDRLREVLVPLQGLALPADVWERDVLPRRTGAYSASWLDQLCAGGEVVWVGAGSLGRNSGQGRPVLPRGRRGHRPAAVQGRAPGRARARPPARAPDRRAVLLHRPAGRDGAVARGDPGGPLGPCVVGRGDQRRLGPAARPAADAGPRAALARRARPRRRAALRLAADGRAGARSRAAGR